MKNNCRSSDRVSDGSVQGAVLNRQRQQVAALSGSVRMARQGHL
jgi:hypothetical protein